MTNQDLGSQFTKMRRPLPQATRMAHLHREFHDTGITYGTSKATHLYSTNINEASKPYGAPYQKSTRSVQETMYNEAQRASLLSATGAPFWFSKDGEIPLSSADQSNPNVEIHSRGKSFRGDPNNSLARYARVYADVSADHTDNNPTPFAGSRNNLHQGQPETWEEKNVPKEDFIKEQANPWGPGGALQRLYGNIFSRTTVKKGTNQDAVIRPPQTPMNTKRNFDN